MLKHVALAFVLAMAAPGAALAAFPERPVKIVVANPPGGPVDVMLRVLAAKLGETWKQPVVVENRPGASGILSTNAVVKAPADGYTLGMVVASALTIVPFAVDNLPYDSEKDLQPISLVARTPFIFIVPADSPYKTWADFTREAKARQLTVGSFSIGTAFHLVWEQTARRAGIEALYVPSSSSGKTQTDLIGGLLDMAVDAPSSAKGLIEAGRVRALAITSPQRFAGLPDTPTLDEAGLSGYAAQPWIGLLAPAGLPAERVQEIHRAVTQVLQEPDVQAQMQTLGMIPVGSTPAELARTISRDRADMAPLVKELGIRLQ